MVVAPEFAFFLLDYRKSICHYFISKLLVSNPKFKVFRPELEVFNSKSRFSIWNFGFSARNFVFSTQSFGLSHFLIATETTEVKINTKFLTKFRWSGNRKNSRSFGQKNWFSPIFDIFSRTFLRITKFLLNEFSKYECADTWDDQQCILILNFYGFQYFFKIFLTVVSK
jgi:hypothetical protein